MREGTSEGGSESPGSGMRMLDTVLSLAGRGYELETVSRLRPWARRRLNTLRPFLVFMRARKPCTFFRRRL